MFSMFELHFSEIKDAKFEIFLLCTVSFKYGNVLSHFTEIGNDWVTFGVTPDFSQSHTRMLEVRSIVLKSPVFPHKGAKI